jgi:hypothetical protein
MPAIMGAGGNFNQMPAWLQQPGAPAAKGRGKKKGSAPAAMRMGTGLPDWYFAQPPSVQRGQRGAAKNVVGRLPDWFFK